MPSMHVSKKSLKKCIKCKSVSTYYYKDSYRWHYVKGKLHCHRCYCVIVSNKKLVGRSVRFLSKRIMMPFVVRTGICAVTGCVNDETDIHHIEYIPIMPVCAMTVELCDMHHREENRRQEELQHEYYFDPDQNY